MKFLRWASADRNLLGLTWEMWTYQWTSLRKKFGEIYPFWAKILICYYFSLTWFAFFIKATRKLGWIYEMTYNGYSTHVASNFTESKFSRPLTVYNSVAIFLSPWDPFLCYNCGMWPILGIIIYFYNYLIEHLAHLPNTCVTSLWVTWWQLLKVCLKTKDGTDGHQSEVINLVTFIRMGTPTGIGCLAFPSPFS